MEEQALTFQLHDNGDDFRIRGAASRRRDERRVESSEACTICLQPISERAIAVPCNHLTFDFICLASWLQEKQKCPLCNAEVLKVEYDWRSPNDFKSYHVPRVEVGQQTQNAFPQNSRRRQQQSTIYHRRRRRSAIEATWSAAEDPALERRRRIYREKLFSLHVGANRVSQYRDFTQEAFATSPELQSRTRMFLRRELQVFSFLDASSAPRGGNREFLLEYIVAILKSNELRGANGVAEDILSEYIGRDNARLLLHELEAWLRSPYVSLDSWDRHVQYADGKSSHASEEVQSTRVQSSS